MKQLIIIGARGYGREVFHFAKESIGYGKDFLIKGFLDDKTDALSTFTGYPPILGSVEDYTIQEDDVFTCALGDVNYKKKYVNIIHSKGGKFINIIHESAKIYPNTVIGEGCIICPNVHISCDIKIGNYVTIQPFSVIGHDVIIGDFCHLNCYSFMGGFSSIGDYVTMNTGAMLHPKKHIENNVVVGAGAFVIRNIKKSGITVVGNPAVEL